MIKKILAILTILIICNSSIIAIDLDSLFIKSIGGTKALTQLRNLNSFTIEGTVNFNEASGTFIEHFKEPNMLYLELKLSNMNLIQAYDGLIAWQQDHNGRVSELSGFERQALLTSIYMESLSYLFENRLVGGYQYLHDTTINEHIYYQVAFYPAYEDTVTVFFDKKTGMKSKIIDKMDNIILVTEFSDYRKINDILFPFEIEAKYLGTTMKMKYYINSIVTNTEINNNIFKKPLNEIADFRFNDTTDQITVPIEYLNDHIWLSASINGKKKVWFLLDSGSSANFFNTRAIADLDLEVTGTMPVMGIAGFDEVQLVKTDSISIGSLTLIDQIAGSMDLTDFDKMQTSDKEFGGILGYDFLSRFPIIVDYQNLELSIFNPENFVPPKEGKVIPFKLTMLIPTIEAKIEGIEGDFIVDLGNAFGLILHNQYAERHNFVDLLSEVKTNRNTFGGIGGTLKSKSGIAASFRIGEILLTNVDVLIPSHGEGLAGSSQLAGNIGNQLLNKFKVLFDYGSNNLIFYQNDN